MISNKKIALFACGIIDNGDEYSLVFVRKIEKMLHYLKKKMVKPPHDEIIIPETQILPEYLSNTTP